MVNGIDFNTDELDDDYIVYYNRLTGYQSDNIPTPEQCGVGLPDDEYYSKLEKVRVMEILDHNILRKWELDRYGKTDKEYAYGKNWEYKPPRQVVVVDRDNIAQYWKPTIINSGTKTPYILDAMNDVKSPNAQGCVIYNSKENPSSNIIIADGEHFTKMTQKEKTIINTIERLSKGNEKISLDTYLNIEEASFNQGILNQGMDLDLTLNKYIQGGNRMSITSIPEIKINPEDIKRINDLASNNTSFLNNIASPATPATSTTGGSMASAIEASFKGGSLGTTSSVYIPTAADMEAAKKKYSDTVPTTPVTTSTAAATTTGTNLVSKIIEKGKTNLTESVAQPAHVDNNELLNSIVAKMATTVNNTQAPIQEVHHSVFTAGGDDTRGTLKEQLLTLSDILMTGINSNNQDIATAINILLDLAGIDNKELMSKQNQGIDYTLFCKVIDQLCDKISYVTDGTAYIINQQIINYVQRTITNGHNSLIEPLYFYEMLAVLAFEGYISLADTKYPELRNSLLQAILYFQKNPMPNVPKEPNHPDGKMDMVPILFGKGGLLETQMVYLNNTAPIVGIPSATQTVYNIGNNLGGNSVNSVFDKYDLKQTTGTNIYQSTVAPAYNYVGTGSTITTPVGGTGTINAFQSGIATALGTPIGGYGAGRDAVMSTIKYPATITTPTTVVSPRYAVAGTTANNIVYGSAVTNPNQQPVTNDAMMNMFSNMLTMLSSIENVGGRNVIDVRNLAGMFSGGVVKGGSVVERFGKTAQPMGTYNLGMWGTGTTYNTWGSYLKPATTLPYGTSSGFGINFNTTSVTPTTSTINYNPAASVGSGVTTLTSAGTWGAAPATTVGSTWGATTYTGNAVQNTGHTVFARQGEDKIAAALGLTR